MSSRKQLKQFIAEVVRASPDYMKKERVRETIQQVITNMVAQGEIKSEPDLESFFASAEMSLHALKMVPFKVYAKLGKSPKS